MHKKIRLLITSSAHDLIIVLLIRGFSILLENVMYLYFTNKFLTTRML